MRQAKLVVMYSLEYYKFKFRKCSLVTDKRLRSGLKTPKHIAPSCLLRLLYFLNFSLSLARAPFISFIYTLSALPILSVLLSSHFPPLLRAAPSPRRPSLSLRPLLLIRPIRPIRPFRVQKKKTSDSCANSPLKLSPVLYKPHAKPSAIPLKSRKTQIFSNFLSQSLARFRKSPYFCTR